MEGTTVTPTCRNVHQTLKAVPVRQAKRVIMGLAAGANVVLPGLPANPISISYGPGASGSWGETRPPDAQKLYSRVGPGGATSGAADAHY